MRTMHTSATLKGWMQAVFAVLLTATLVACGGGGGDNSSSNSNSGSGNNGTNSVNSGSLPASPTQQPIAANAANTVPITVNAGTSNVVNIPGVSVRICAPGSTTNCQTIDNVQLDTGSFGLRLVSSVINPALLSALTPVTANGTTPLAECASFADGFTWGAVRSATVVMGGETTKSAIPIQVIGDTSAGPTPTSGCGSGPAENTVADLGANGILGVGTALTDCGATCATAKTAATFSNYIQCVGSSCSRATVQIAQQVANPVANFVTDNNGLIVQMPPISNSGAASASGTLVFGIGTQSNNGLAASQMFTTDGFGDMNNSTFNGTTVQAFLDSGSNGYFFADSTLPACGSNVNGFYCPSTSQTRSVTLVGLNKTTAAVNIGIANAQTLFSNTSNFAFNDLAGQIGGSTSFDLGLPFFYGRHVYYGFDNGVATPFVGF
ncbi:DUF3443 domain-containing protein [Paraburkholderia sp. ZP32-5]|uniref:DUF3443 domain-containing protein n=1 Tax=Paraburkholderia sp. ZP32-5 TaxID=2883245 RepID=UPI001F2F60ED|nr:DUF3443 domain-containing protein [Paraburkholderia sp. ZP32-5]